MNVLLEGIHIIGCISNTSTNMHGEVLCFLYSFVLDLPHDSFQSFNTWRTLTVHRLVIPIYSIELQFKCFIDMETGNNMILYLLNLNEKCCIIFTYLSLMFFFPLSWLLP